MYVRAVRLIAAVSSRDFIFPRIPKIDIPIFRTCSLSLILCFPSFHFFLLFLFVLLHRDATATRTTETLYLWKRYYFAGKAARFHTSETTYVPVLVAVQRVSNYRVREKHFTKTQIPPPRRDFDSILRSEKLLLKGFFLFSFLPVTFSNVQSRARDFMTSVMLIKFE